MAGSVASRLTKTAMGSNSDSSAAGATKPAARLDLHPLTGADIQRFTEELAARLGVTGKLAPRGVRVQSRRVSIARSGEASDSPFLNSFLVGDLGMVASALREGNVGAGLAGYLASGQHIGSIKRIDVRQEPLAVLADCAPLSIPPGRWVTNTDHALALGQQFAVNQIMDRLADRAGLLAVNGPPGTGKTTMLRDLVAAVIVERAFRLSRLNDPHEVFAGTPVYTWPTAKYRHTVVVPKSDVTGFEMVVSSTNNGAVENVTTEIPGPRGIGDQWRNSGGDLGYFTETARLVCGDGAWAMVAAKLGNRTNRHAFVQSFWWGTPENGADRTAWPRSQRPGRGTGNTRVPGDGMCDVLKRLEAEPGDWLTTVAEFRHALGRVRELATERENVAAAIERLSIAQARCTWLTETIPKIEARYANLTARQPRIEQRMGTASSRWETADARCKEHQAEKPGLIVSLSTLFRAGREWHADDQELRRRREEAERERDAVRQDAETNQRRIADTQRDLRGARKELTRLGEEIDTLHNQIEEARRRWGPHLPAGPEFSATDKAELVERRERSSPWADEEFSSARTELFVAALRLHKAFVAAEAPTVRKNLSALMDILEGKIRPAPHVALAAWQTFFLVVPVVSSAFASIDRLFSGFGRESLGWLFIDEAGQAAPQQAAGAIWRAKRTVVVGDPLQMEPVVTTPWAAQRALLHHFGVEEERAPSRTSVQGVADRLASYGTWLPAARHDGSDRVWVGMPLRVHRRCDRPMFDICNLIAYDGLMVYGTGTRSSFYGSNVWYDVRSGHSQGHWIPAEGQVLQDVLTDLRHARVPVEEIRVISPFRQVVSEAKDTYRQVFPDGDVSRRDRDRWVGTVHTMQGKEADVVILVLGGNPGRPGARRWAAETPNLLNVAVSRARRRLYVIGNREAWGHLRYFDVLADSLPAQPPTSTPT